jgi:hypothetical protein
MQVEKRKCPVAMRLFHTSRKFVMATTFGGVNPFALKTSTTKGPLRRSLASNAVPARPVRFCSGASMGFMFPATTTNASSTRVCKSLTVVAGVASRCHRE